MKTTLKLDFGTGNAQVIEQPESKPPVRSSDLLAAVEAAYREGYGAGYENGANDHAAYEQGCGNKHRNAQKRDEDGAWIDSEAQTANAGTERQPA